MSMEIPGAPNFKVKAEYGDKTFYVNREILCQCSPWFKVKIDEVKGKDDCITLREDAEIVEQLIQHIYGMGVESLETDTIQEAVAHGTEIDSFDIICKLRDLGKRYGVASLEVAAMTALKNLVEGCTSVETLPELGGTVFEDDSTCSTEIRMSIAQKTAKCMKAVLEDGHAFDNVYDREDYIRMVFCCMSGCEPSEAGIEHTLVVAPDEMMGGQ